MASGANDYLFEMYELPKGNPIPLGHESVGTVVEIGNEVTTCKVGDRVLLLLHLVLYLPSLHFLKQYVKVQLMYNVMMKDYLATYRH